MTGLEEWKSDVIEMGKNHLNCTFETVEWTQFMNNRPSFYVWKICGESSFCIHPSSKQFPQDIQNISNIQWHSVPWVLQITPPVIIPIQVPSWVTEKK